MILKDYEKLPEKMKNEKVKEYYDIISKKKISLVMKRIFDIFFSLVLLIILSPILLILAIIQTKILINGNFIFIIGASIICTIIIETFCEWMDENWEED